MQQPKGECYCVFNGIAEDTLAPRKRIETSCNEQNWHQRWLRRCNTAATDLFREAAKIRPVLNPGWAFNMWLGEVSGMRILVSLPHDKTEEVLEWLDEELRYVNRIVQPIYGVEYMLNHSMKPASWRVAEIRAIGLR